MINCYMCSWFPASPLNLSYEEKVEVDNRSIYVGNVSIIMSIINITKINKN